MTFVACLVFMHDSVEIMVTQQAFLLKNYWKCDLPVNPALMIPVFSSVALIEAMYVVFHL